MYEIIQLLTKIADKADTIMQFNKNFCFKFCLTLPLLTFLWQFNTLGLSKGFIYILYHKFTYIHLEVTGSSLQY